MIMTMGLFISFPQSVKSASNPTDYSVSPVLPTNQKQGASGYFDLLVKPNQEQTVSFKINNGSKKKTTFEVYFNPAMTSDGGAIDYGIRNAKVDKSVPFDIRDVVKLDKNSYTVPAMSSMEIPVHIKLTDKTWTGRVLGGINIQKTVKGDQSATSGNSASMNTKVAYSVALVLQQSLAQISPDLQYTKTAPAKVNGYTTFQLGFRNPTTTIILDLIFTTVLTKDGKKFIENTSNKYTVAPSTFFHVNLGMDGQRVEPGKYHVDVTAKSGPFYSWHFSDDFEVEAEKAEAVNKNAIFPQESGTNIWKIVAVVAIVIFVLALILLFIIWKKKKKQNNQEQSQQVN